MGGCSISKNCNSVCGGLKKMTDVFLFNDEIYKNNRTLAKIKQIQSNYKGYRFRHKFKLLLSKNLNTTFLLKQKPGIDININTHPIILTKNIIDMENILGPFKFNEKDFSKTVKAKNLRRFCLMYPDNSIYDGYYNSKWQKEGYGVHYSRDGCKYEGYFVNDLKHGPGRFLHIDGYYYEGYSQFGNSNGFGKYQNLDGNTYIGNWKDDQQDGLGEQIFSDNSRYEGNFENGI